MKHIPTFHVLVWKKGGKDGETQCKMFWDDKDRRSFVKENQIGAHNVFELSPLRAVKHTVLRATGK